MTAYEQNKVLREALAEVNALIDHVFIRADENGKETCAPIARQALRAVRASLALPVPEESAPLPEEREWRVVYSLAGRETWAPAGPANSKADAEETLDYLRKQPSSSNERLESRTSAIPAGPWERS